MMDGQKDANSFLKGSLKLDMFHYIILVCKSLIINYEVMKFLKMT
jgi:hypothetical protein